MLFFFGPQTKRSPVGKQTPRAREKAAAPIFLLPLQAGPLTSLVHPAPWFPPNRWRGAGGLGGPVASGGKTRRAPPLPAICGLQWAPPHCPLPCLPVVVRFLVSRPFSEEHSSPW